MTKAEKISDYVRDYFHSCGLCFEEYFYDFTVGEGEEILWTEKDKKRQINKAALSYAAEILGIEPDDIVNDSIKAFGKWNKKFPYLEYITEFNFEYKRTYYGKAYDSIRMFEVIFEQDMSGYYGSRYDLEDIKTRLVGKLMEIDKSMPGTIHKNADIMNLKVSTNNFCHFENIKEMTESYLDMLQRAKYLFVKAVHDGLGSEEIKEYNFLTTILGIKDAGVGIFYLHYSNLMNIKDIYKDVTVENFESYVVFRRILNFKPWRSSDFINDRELVEKYLSAVPTAKKEMRDFGMNALNFCCDFVWTDAKPIIQSDEFDDYDYDGLETVPYNERAKERTVVYIEKKADEFNGDENTAAQLLKYCRPAKLGGVRIDIPKIADGCAFNLMKIVGKVLPANFVDRMNTRLSELGGCDNE